jgi:two-component system sporulation sensor kinase A
MNDKVSSESKRIKDALRESEEMYRGIVELTPDGIVTVDTKGVITLCNTATTTISGFSKDEIVGKHFSKLGFLRAKDISKYLKVFGSIVRGKVPEPFEIAWQSKDGTPHLVDVHVSLIKKEGKTIGIQAIVRDITKRKQAQEALRKSEEKYRSIIELAPDGIVTANMKGVVTSINPAFSRLTGFSSDEIVGKHFTKLATIPKRDFPKYLKLLGSILRGTIPKPFEFVYNHKNGTSGWGEAHIGILEADGRKSGFQVILRDITERKRMEEKLRQYSEHLENLVRKRTKELSESEKRYSVLVEEARDIVAIIQDGKIVFINRKGSEVMGYSQEELIGLPYENIVAEKYRQLAHERYERRMRGEMAPSIYEIELLSKTGEHVPVELGATRIDHQGRLASLIFARDIRERKQMEEQHLKLEKLATMGELATMVAHDLRNPLTSIRNAGYYIKNTCPYRTNTERKTTLEMLNIIEQETIFANNIINDLLDFAAKRPLQKKRQNINEIIEDSLTKGNIPRNIEVKRNFAKKAIIDVDEKQLERVFLNLIKNSVQAMPDGGKLVVTTKETKDNVKIIFADTGVGISEENISKLFTPLFTTKAKGIGMGLAICKNIVEQHNGTIEVKSKAGQGTTFTIKLPKGEEAKNQ